MADQPSTDQQDVFGRKVFFLYPPRLIEEEMVPIIVDNEYEPYMIRDHAKIVPLLRGYSGSVLYLNLDYEVKGLDWGDYAKALMSSAETQDVQIGVVSAREDKELVRKFIIDLKVPCGFMRLKAALDDSTRIMLSSLRAIHANDKRRFVRAVCNDGSFASFNVKVQGTFLTGVIRDISAAGMAAVFESQQVHFDPQTVLEDVQLKLRGRLCRATGVVIGRRSQSNGPEIHVVLFAKDTDQKTKDKLHSFIYELLSAQMEQRISGLRLPRAEAPPSEPEQPEIDLEAIPMPDSVEEPKPDP